VSEDVGDGGTSRLKCVKPSYAAKRNSDVIMSRMTLRHCVNIAIEVAGFLAADRFILFEYIDGMRSTIQNELY